jgi:AraC-like DNA-binding protein
MLERHRFQFNSFCPVLHAEPTGGPKPQVNEDLHLLHITQGRAVLRLDGDSHALEPGVVVAIPPYAPFTFAIRPTFEMLNIHYQLWLADGLPLQERWCLPRLFRPADFTAIEHTLRDMKRLLRQTGPDAVRLAALAHDVVLRHLSTTELIPVQCGRAVDARAERLRVQLTTPRSTRYAAPRAAAASALSVSQMNRLFRRAYGTSACQFWNQQRFGRVCAALAHSDLPVRDIARDCGFEDQAYFSRWFRSRSGVAPREYRRGAGLSRV